MTNEEKRVFLEDRIIKFGYFYSPLFQDEHICLLKPGFEIKKYVEDEDLFILNSRYRDGKNMYKEFLNKNYYSHFTKEQKNNYSRLLMPYLTIARHDGHLIFRFATIISYNFLLNEYNEKQCDKDDNYYSENYKKIKEKLNFLKDSIKKKTLSYNQAIMANTYINTINNDLEFIESLNDIKPYDFDVTDFYECFDVDKLCLVYGKIILSKLKTYDKDNDDLFPLFPQLYNYIHFVDELKIDNYNPKIVINEKQKNGKYKKINYTFKDFRKQVEDYLKKRKDISFKYVSVFDPVLDDEHKDNTMEELSKEAVKFRYGEELVISKDWEFIRKGEIEKDTTLRKHNNESKVLNEKQIDIKSRIDVFQKTEYVCKIVGTNKFTGYVGYIYPNGLVAFEKFYEEDGTYSNKNNATYIMTIENFKDFTKLSKPEIIEYIKKTDNPSIDRKYHNKNWEHNIRKIVEGDYYSKDKMEMIDNLIKQVNLTKKLEKLQ